jgi:hypothetical protein
VAWAVKLQMPNTNRRMLLNCRIFFVELNRFIVAKITVPLKQGGFPAFFFEAVVVFRESLLFFSCGSFHLIANVDLRMDAFLLNLNKE